MISYIIIGTLVVTVAILNVARGQGWFPSKVIAYALMGLAGAAGFYGAGNWLSPDFHRIGATFGVLTLGLWGCFAFGWGKFFPTGWNRTPQGRLLWEEREFLPAEWIANLICGDWDQEESEDFVKNWQTVAMTARFALTFTLLLFPLLAFAVGDWKAALCGLPMIFAGLIYRLCFVNHTTRSVAWAECITGALLGGCVGLAVI